MFWKKKGCSLVAQDLASSPSSAPGNEAAQDCSSISNCLHPGHLPTTSPFLWCPLSKTGLRKLAGAHPLRPWRSSTYHHPEIRAGGKRERWREGRESCSDPVSVQLHTPVSLVSAKQARITVHDITKTRRDEAGTDQQHQRHYGHPCALL